MVPIRCALVGATPLLGGLDRLSEATIVSLVPTQLARLASAPPPSSLRAVIVGGGPLEPDLQRAAQEAGWPVLPTYGMTEVASMVTCVRPGQRGLGHCGRPLPGHRLLIDGGEILVSRGDGWLRTGDLGRIDERGNLIVDGRREDLILTGGENVRPAEVERALLRHPAVDAACAFGLEDGEWGQRVCAAIVVRGEAVEDVEILARAGESLARYKLPRELIRLDALPRNGLGKLQRALLRERLSARC
jgi:O-succinylbenzoic acid--CoA ligase